MKKGIEIKVSEALRAIYGEDVLLILYDSAIIDGQGFHVFADENDEDDPEYEILLKLKANKHIKRIRKSPYNGSYRYYDAEPTEDFKTQLKKYFVEKVNSLSREELIEFVLSRSKNIQRILKIPESYLEM